MPFMSGMRVLEPQNGAKCRVLLGVEHAVADQVGQRAVVELAKAKSTVRCI